MKEPDEQRAKLLLAEFSDIRHSLVNLARDSRPERGETTIPGLILRMDAVLTEVGNMGYRIVPTPDSESDSIKVTSVLKFASKTLRDSDLRLDTDPDYDPAEHTAVMRTVLALVDFLFANQKDRHRQDLTLFFLRSMEN